MPLLSALVVDGHHRNIPGTGALAVGSGSRVPDGFVRHIGGIEVEVVGVRG